MKTANHECYVSIEVAKLLKAAGFDWEASHWYEVLSDGQVMYSDGSTYNWNNPCYGESTFSMPTIDVAQRWLREVKNLSVDIYSTRNSEWEYIIRKINQVNYNDNIILALTACRFYTYEDTLESGIKNALEIILEKGE